MLRAGADAERDLLRRAFATYVVADDEARDANYSLRLSPDTDQFHRLYRGSCLVTASPDPRRVVAALVRNVQAHAPAPPGLLAIKTILLVRAGQATFVPTLLEDHVRILGRRLGEQDIQQVDTHTALLDLDAREVVVERQLLLDDAALDDLVAAFPSGRRTDAPVPDGRYPLVRWLMMELWDQPGRYSRATATRRAALMIGGGPLAAGFGVLDRLATCFSTVVAEGIDPKSRTETLDLIRGAS